MTSVVERALRQTVTLNVTLCRDLTQCIEEVRTQKDLQVRVRLLAARLVELAKENMQLRTGVANRTGLRDSAAAEPAGNAALSAETGRLSPARLSAPQMGSSTDGTTLTGSGTASR